MEHLSAAPTQLWRYYQFFFFWNKHTISFKIRGIHFGEKNFCSIFFICCIKRVIEKLYFINYKVQNSKMYAPYFKACDMLVSNQFLFWMFLETWLRTALLKFVYLKLALFWKILTQNSHVQLSRATQLIRFLCGMKDSPELFKSYFNFPIIHLKHTRKDSRR